MPIEYDSKPLLFCLGFILAVFVLDKLLRKQKPILGAAIPWSKRYQAARSLGHLPGTWHSRFTSLGTVLHLIRFRKARYVDSLFQKYGDVVRIGPAKVAFRDTSALKEVYGFSGKYDKSTRYQILQLNGVNQAFTTLSHADHARKRKIFISFYAASNLHQHEGHIMKIIHGLTQVLHGTRSKETVEVIEMFKHLLTDIGFATTIGHGVGATMSWSRGAESELSRLIGFVSRKGFVQWLAPIPIWKMLKSIPFGIVHEFMHSDKLLGRLIEPEVTKAINSAKLQGSEMSMQPNCLLNYLVQNRKDLTDSEIHAEVFGHIIASVESASMVITYALYKIATPMASVSGKGATPNPFQERLFAELSNLHSSNAPANEHAQLKDGLRGNFHDIDSLPFLDALLKETLRLFGSGPSLHPRIIPPGKTLSIQGKAIPGGTEVGLQFMSIHQRSSVWERADEFLPERWLPSNLGGLGPEPGSDGYDQMMQHYMPFGPGTRSCAGKNLAMMVMKLVITSVAREFQIWVNNEETNEETMEPRDSDFFLFPKSLECKLGFTPRN